jgi:hypothetical protein
MEPRDTNETLRPAETELAAKVAQFPAAERLRPKPRCKPQEMPSQLPPVPDELLPVTTNRVLHGRMKRSGQPLQVWTSPYEKVPPPPAKSEIALNHIKTAIGHIKTAIGRIKSATRPAFRERVRLYTQGCRSWLVARFRHSV